MTCFIEENAPNLVLKGFMCIDEKSPHIQVDCASCSFSKMNAIGKRFRGFPQLSMGMTDDYKHALKHGATIIRVGSAIFGTLKK